MTPSFSPDDQIDPQDLQVYIAGRRPFSSLVPPATLVPSGASYGQGFSPDSDQSWSNSRWYGDPPDPAAFNVSSSGPEGTGSSAQPKADMSQSDPGAAAGKVLNGTAPRMPPPGLPVPYVASPDAQVRTPQQPQSAAPVDQTNAQIADIQQGMANLKAPQMIGDRPQDIDPNTGKVKTGARLASWAQRLAMAVLSAGKLAPYAQQIVRPEYSGEMAAYNAAENLGSKKLKDLADISQAQSWEDQRAATAAERRALADKASSDADERVRANQEREQIRRATDFTRSLGKPEDLIEGLQATDPQIPQLQAQGWQILDDIRYPNGGMKVARPPAAMQITPEMAEYFPGRTVGTLVPYSEYKSALNDFQKRKQDAIMHPPPQGTINPTLLAVRAQGQTTGDARVDSWSPEAARKALELSKERPPTINVNSSPTDRQPIAEKLAWGDFDPAQLGRYPDKEQIVKDAITINPKWTPQIYAAKKSFTDPEKTQAKNLATISRIVSHIGRFEQNSKEMGTAPGYALGINLTGGQNALNEDAHGISAELEKLLSGGVGSVEQTRQWQRALHSPDPGARQRAIDEISQLIGGQYEGMNQSYKSAIGTDLPIEQYVSPSGLQWMQSKGINVTNTPSSGATGGPAPIALKDGTFLTPHDQAAADKFRKDHRDLIK